MVCETCNDERRIDLNAGWRGPPNVERHHWHPCPDCAHLPVTVPDPPLTRIEVVPAEQFREAIEALQGILDAWPRHLFNVPQEAVDRFVAAMDEGQDVVDRRGGQ